MTHAKCSYVDCFDHGALAQERERERLKGCVLKHVPMTEGAGTEGESVESIYKMLL